MSSSSVIGMQRQSLLLDWVFYKRRYGLCLPCVLQTISPVLTTVLEMHFQRCILALSALFSSVLALVFSSSSSSSSYPSDHLSLEKSSRTNISTLPASPMSEHETPSWASAATLTLHQPALPIRHTTVRERSGPATLAQQAA